MLDTQGVWRILRFNWLFIVILALLGAGAGAALAFRATPLYTADAQLIVTVTSGATTGELNQGSNYSQQQARNYAAVASREIVLAPVLEDLRLETDVDGLRKIVSASVPLNTAIVSISVENPDAELAAKIANATARSLAATAGQLAPRVDEVKGSPVKLVVIETAVAPETPSSPNRPLMILVGLLAGVLISLALLVLRELLGAKVRTVEQAASLVPAHMLGSVQLPRNPETEPIAVVHEPHSETAEGFRQLRTNLRFIQNDDAHKAILVTSSMSGEGKSTIAANLAAAMAASRSRVCLVEADLRRPSLAKLLDLTDGAGLATVLVGEAKAEDVLQPWGPDGLHVIVAGEIPPNPSELLESQRAAQVFADLRSRFDVIVVDSPPVNGIADASILAKLLGGALFVVGAKVAKERDVRHALEQLATVEAPVHGTVFNAGRAGVLNRATYSYRAAAKD